MKKVFIGILAFLSISQIQAQKLQIDGDIKNLPEGTTVSLIDGMANKVVDSAKMVDGKFKLSNQVTDPGLYVLSFSALQAKIPYFFWYNSIRFFGWVFNHCVWINIKSIISFVIILFFNLGIGVFPKYDTKSIL